MKPGFHQLILDGIKEKSCTFTEQEKIVVITFDKMSIKTGLLYEERLDSVVGFEDLGETSRSRNIANYATVFMVRGLFV